MRITKEIRHLVHTQGVKGITQVCQDQLADTIESLKKARDIKDVCTYQGVINTLEFLIKAAE